MDERNLAIALSLGLITWFEYFEALRRLHD